MVRFAALVLVVGCYQPSIHEGSACETVCPGDLVCVEHVCRVPGSGGDDAGMADGAADASPLAVDAAPDGPPADTDSDDDGRLDTMDNCPQRANADQYNEDGDSLGDVCDPCPHLSGNAADQDSDGVGDACDPQPNIGKQRIKFFDPFNASLAGWSHDTGVTRSGGKLRLDGRNGGIQSELATTTGALRIHAAGSIPVVSATTPHQISISFGYNAAGDDFHYAEFYDQGAGGDVAITEADSGNYNTLNARTYAGTMPTGAWSMRIDESVTAQTINLAATLGGTVYAPFSATTNTAPLLLSGPKIVVWIWNIEAHLDYFLVIETLP